MEIRRVSHAIGAEVIGVDLAKPLSPAQWSGIRQAWLDHMLLIFPAQQMNPDQLIAFAKRFGPLDDHSDDPSDRLPGYPEIYQIGNHLVDGKVSKTRDTGRLWHSDHSYTTRPTLISMLYCRAIPPVGGTTMFANMYMAYDTLSEKMKEVVESLEAVHDFLNFMEAGSFFWKPTIRNAEALRAKFPPVVHPVVKVHPETGRKALYVSEAQTRRFAGMTEEEGRGIIEFLLKHTVRPEFTHRLIYRKDDLVFWDNRCTQHIALADYVHGQSSPRLMQRLTVLGDHCGRLYEPAVS